MKLIDTETALDLVHNALFTWSDESGLQFSRFSEQQKVAYAKRSGTRFAQHVTGASNITLEMITDSDVLAFDISLCESSSGRFTAIDFLVDGVLYDSVSFAHPYRKTSVCFKAPSGTHRLTVYFPWCAAGKIQNLAVAENSFVMPTEKSVRILALGDSITQGYLSRHPSLSYIGRITETMNAEVLNQGIGGYRFFAESLCDDVAFYPDVITLAYGTNDYTFVETEAEFVRYAVTYLKRLNLLYPDTPVLMITPIYRQDQDLVLVKHNYSFERATALLKECAKPYSNITVLEGLSFFPHHTDFLSEDRLHPNDLGFSLYAQAVEGALKNILW